MKQKVIDKSNPILHFLKLLALDIFGIWAIGFCIIFASWMVRGAGAASYVLPNLFAILLITIIWILATLPFTIKYKLIKSNDNLDRTKLNNYKLILVLNSILFMLFLIAIIISPM